MGTLGSGPFDNDDAMDWASMLLDAPDGMGDEENPGRTGLLIGPIGLIDQLDDDEYLEAPDAAVAIAAIEVLAAIRGRPNADLSKASDDEDDMMGQLAEWANGSARSDADFNDPEVTEAAIDVLHRVRDHSELAELWSESDDAGEAWKASINDLLKRLQG